MEKTGASLTPSNWPLTPTNGIRRERRSSYASGSAPSIVLLDERKTTAATPRSAREVTKSSSCTPPGKHGHRTVFRPCGARVDSIRSQTSAKNGLETYSVMTAMS